MKSKAGWKDKKKLIFFFGITKNKREKVQINNVINEEETSLKIVWTLKGKENNLWKTLYIQIW